MKFLWYVSARIAVQQLTIFIKGERMVDDRRNTKVHLVTRQLNEAARSAKYAQAVRHRLKPSCSKTPQERLDHALAHGMTRGKDVEFPSGKVDKVFLVLHTGFLKFEDETQISPFDVKKV